MPPCYDIIPALSNEAYDFTMGLHGVVDWRGWLLDSTENWATGFDAATTCGDFVGNGSLLTPSDCGTFHWLDTDPEHRCCACNGGSTNLRAFALPMSPPLPSCQDIAPELSSQWYNWDETGAWRGWLLDGAHLKWEGWADFDQPMGCDDFVGTGTTLLSPANCSQYSWQDTHPVHRCCVCGGGEEISPAAPPSSPPLETSPPGPPHPSSPPALPSGISGAVPPSRSPPSPRAAPGDQGGDDNNDGINGNDESISLEDSSESTVSLPALVAAVLGAAFALIGAALCWRYRSKLLGGRPAVVTAKSGGRAQTSRRSTNRVGDVSSTIVIEDRQEVEMHAPTRRRVTLPGGAVLNRQLSSCLARMGSFGMPHIGCFDAQGGGQSLARDDSGASTAADVWACNDAARQGCTDSVRISMADAEIPPAPPSAVTRARLARATIEGLYGGLQTTACGPSPRRPQSLTDRLSRWNSFNTRKSRAPSRRSDRSDAEAMRI